MALLDEHSNPLSDALVLVLTTVASEAGREVAVQPSKAKAKAFIDEILEIMGKLYVVR
jgi:hypothetical protein